MLQYWPVGAGIVVFIGLVLVVMKLIRRKRDDEEIQIPETHEEEPSANPVDIGKHMPAVGVALAALSLVAVFMVWISMPSESLIRSQMMAKADKSEITRLEVEIENRPTVENVNDLVAKSHDQITKEYKGYIDNTVVPTVKALNAKVGETSRYAARVEARVARLEGKVDTNVNLVNGQLNAYEAKFARQDSINAEQKAFNGHLAKAINLELTPEQEAAFARVVARDTVSVP